MVLSSGNKNNTNKINTMVVYIFGLYSLFIDLSLNRDQFVVYLHLDILSVTLSKCLCVISVWL